MLIAIDVGMRGILRRLGVENSSEGVLKFFNTQLPYNLISWDCLQPLSTALKEIGLTVPRQMLSVLHPADLAELISQVSGDKELTFSRTTDGNTFNRIAWATTIIMIMLTLMFVVSMFF